MPTGTDRGIAGSVWAVVRLALTAVALLSAAGMLLSAYSMYLQPSQQPLLSLAGLAFPIFALVNLAFLLFFLLTRSFKSALVPVAAFLLCLPQINTYMPLFPNSSEAPEGSIKLLTYNTKQMGELRLDDEGRSELLDYLAASNADIICLQEYGTRGGKGHLSQQMVNQALDSLPYHQIVTVGHGSDHLACYSRFPILKAENMQLQSDYNGAAVFSLLIGTDTLQLISTHLESNKLTSEDKEMYTDMIRDPEKEKVKQGSKVLLRKLADANVIRQTQVDSIRAYLHEHPGKYTVICGDFNDSPLSYAHHTLSQGMDDAFVRSGRGLGISYHENRFYFRIDHILTGRNISSYGCRVDGSIKASDHYPVYCYLHLD